MFIRKLAAGTALLGALTLGPVAIAGADTPQPAPTVAAKCTAARDLLAKAHQREDAVTGRISAVEARIAELEQRGKTARAAVLQKRLDVVKDRLTKVEARVAKLEARIDAKCGGAAQPTVS